jgi:trk system potassium uptake protein TrkA
MKQVAILGLSYFGKSVLDELLEMNVEVLIIDKDRDVVDAYKDSSATAIVMDVMNAENLRHALPATVDAVIIDMGDRIEASILTTSYCKKIGIKTIIVKAETEAHGEILNLVGATKVVFPNREAAKRITPLLISSTLLNYLPVSGKLVIAEMEIPNHFWGKTVLETDLRRKYALNLISVRRGTEEYGLFAPEYRFQEGDIALVSGTDEALEAFTGKESEVREKSSLLNNFKKLFHQK